MGRSKESLDRTKNLIETIAKTLAHLRGKTKMKDEELYYGFDSEKQKAHEKNLVEKGIVTKEFLDECNKKVKNWSDEEKNAFIHDMERIMKGLIAEIGKNAPSSDIVQNLVQEHFIWLQRTWNPSKEKYIGLIELYQTPEFRKFYDDRHPQLLEFFIEAMKVYAKREFS